MNLFKMSPPVLIRSWLPYAQQVLTLDALHSATMDSLRGNCSMPALAACDKRLAAAAIGEGYELADC